MREHAREVERAAAAVTRINAQTARQADQQSRIQERAAKRLADEKIREGRRGLREIERQLAQEVRANREAQREIQRAAAANQQRRGAFLAGAAGGVSALIGVSAISEIRNAASAWIDYASKLENTKIAFTTMMGSADAAQAHLKELQAFARTTPFQFSDLIDASQRMQALGFNAQQVIPVLTDVGNAVAAAGGGSERLDRVVTALSQIQSKGKVMTQELNQLAEAGIPAWRMMEAQLGKSRAELIKMVEAGEISSDVFIKLFQEFSKQNYGGLMEAQSKTFTGALSNIKDSLLEIAEVSFAPLYERLKETAQKMADFAAESKKAQDESTKAQKNTEGVGVQLVRVWDGAVEALYIFRDALSIVSAIATQIIAGLTHLFLALVSEIVAALNAAEAFVYLLKGDFAAAMEAMARSEHSSALATSELTDAAKSQTMVVDRLGQIWTEAGDRAAAAANKMRNAGIVAASVVGALGEPLDLGELGPGAGFFRKATATIATTGGGRGSAKKGKVDNTARDAFRAETQALRDEISERLSAYRDETAKIKSQYDQRLTDFASYMVALRAANKERLEATLALLRQELAQLENAYAQKRAADEKYIKHAHAQKKRLIKDDEYIKRESEIQKAIAKATAEFNVEEARLETESYEHRLRLQQNFDQQRAELRDQKTADDISDLTRLRDIATQDAEWHIQNEQDRAKAILAIEIEYGEKVKTLRLQQLERAKEAIYAEVRAIAERLAEVKNISIEEAMASKVVQDALAERAIEIEAIEQKRKRIIKEASDANIDAYRKEAQAARDVWEAFRSAAQEAAGKAAKAGGWQQEETTPADLSIWDAALGAIEERMGRTQDVARQFHDAMSVYVVGAFHGMAEAATDAVQAWILYGGSLGKALKQALAAELAAIAARAAIQAALHAAYAIGSLAFGNFAAAAQHGIAAAKFAAVAALTGIAARGLAGSAASSGSATAGSAFQNATRAGSGSTTGQPTTIDVNRRSSAPTVRVTVKLQGDIATDALKTRVVDAVVESLDLNDPRLTTQVQSAAQRGR